jgi:hypothetical protein
MPAERLIVKIRGAVDHPGARAGLAAGVVVLLLAVAGERDRLDERQHQAG